MLGLCYEMGYGVDTDETQAVAWYMEATKYDYADAEYRLGMCYKEGKGIARSYPHAASWLLKAGQKGNVDAQREAAICYEMLNQATAAARLFLAAAEAGDLYSEEKIAEYYNLTQSKCYIESLFKNNLTVSRIKHYMNLYKNTPIGEYLTNNFVKKNE
jgi:TPR repeat protein